MEFYTSVPSLFITARMQPVSTTYVHHTAGASTGLRTYIQYIPTGRPLPPAGDKRVTVLTPASVFTPLLQAERS